jgi:hypothetical protein
LNALVRKRPAIYKLLLLPKVAQKLRNNNLQRIFTELYDLKSFDLWLSKKRDGVEPPLQLKRGVLDIISRMHM